jgi:hypothetical protein
VDEDPCSRPYLIATDKEEATFYRDEGKKHYIASTIE